jgi:hypothetical protein
MRLERYTGQAYDLNNVQLAEGTSVSRIEILRTGTWNHPKYGKLNITTTTLKNLNDNFKAGVRKAVPVDREHITDGGAVGWINNLELSEDGSILFADVEWNADGVADIKSKRYRFISADFMSKYSSKTDSKVFNDVLLGAAITTRPYIEELSEVSLSEMSSFEEGGEVQMTKEEMRKKLLSDPNYVPAENDKELCDTVRKEIASDAKKMSDKEESATQLSEGGVSYKKYNDGTVTLSEDQLKVLISNAAEGSEAKKENEKIKLSDKVGEFIFSEKNETGVFVPAAKDELLDLVVTLSEEQRSKLYNVLGHMKKLDPKMFSEQGSGTTKTEEGDSEVPEGVSEGSHKLTERANKLLSENVAKYAGNDRQAYYDAEAQLLNEGVLKKGENY